MAPPSTKVSPPNIEQPDIEQPDTERTLRPWGSFDQYAHNENVTVSLMHVKPGQRLSLQSHTGRAELWIVFDDGAEVQIDERTLHPKQGEELWIPVGAKHRLSNPSDATVRVLEVAFGDWQLDDIERFDDMYDRSS